MNEIPRILEAWRAVRAAGEDAVLATVVKVEGSAYRRPGARMLITADGKAVGTISGGCLESLLIKRAWWLTEGGEPRVCRYNTAADEDAQWSFGLGCNGVVHVLLERLSARRASVQLDLLQAARDAMRPAATAVVIAAHGGGGVRVGERLVRWPDGTLGGGVSDVGLARRLADDLETVVRERSLGGRSYLLLGAQADVFVELLTPPVRLVVLGAGHDACPLVHFAKALGWHVIVADGRAHFARRDRFPEADAVVVTAGDDPLRGCGISPDSFVVLMSHSIEQDRAALARLLRAPPRYIGLLGPRSRTERMLCELAELDSTIAGALPALHYPVGLDIGAENPEEIAIAIVAEIRAVLAGRPGVMLRERVGPIHEADVALTLEPRSALCANSLASERRPEAIVE